MVMPTNPAISNATTPVVSQNPPTSNEGKVGDKSVELATTGAQASKTASRTEAEAPQSASTKDIGAIDEKKKAEPPKEYPMTKHTALAPNTRLNQISMLGSHDAGTYAFSSQSGISSMGTLMPGSFKTQNQNLVDQAKFGATYFDVRISGESFVHGPSSDGNAVEDFKDLLKYASEDKSNIFIVKLELPKGILSNPKKFDDKVFEGVKDHLITPQDIKNLPGEKKSHVGELTLEDTSNMGKNIVILYKDADGVGAKLGIKRSEEDPKIFDYKSEVALKWPDTRSTNGVIKSLKDQINDEKNKDALNKKIVVMQTNIPVGKKGVKAKLENSQGRLVEAMAKEIKQQGVISGDYIGHDKGTYQGYREIINDRNNQLKPPAAEKAADPAAEKKVDA
jgi:hypothetical protein